MDLVGDLLGSAAVAAALTAPRACEAACCAEPRCRGYSITAFAPAPGFDNCFLYANVTELMPNVAVASWVARSAL